MITNLQQLTALFPCIIILLTLLTVVLSISYDRNHFFIATCTIFGFSSALCSLYFLISIVPINITFLFHVTGHSILYIAIVLISSISTCIFAYPWLLKYPFNKEEFYLLILIASLGAISLIVSNHLSSLLVAIELMSLPIFGLIGYSSYQKQSLEASFKYVILSGVSSSFLLMGIAWVYSVCSDLSFISINKSFDLISSNEKLVLLYGIVMIFFSLFFKLSIVPFHLWIPDVYQGTSSLVLSFFSTAGKIAIFSVLLNFLSYIAFFNAKILYLIISLLTIFSILFGNLMALFQKDFKRFFGYSAISQIGYLFIVFLVSDQNYIFSLESSSIYLFSYVISNILCFGIMNLISISNKNNDANLISSYQGLFWSDPLLSTVLTLVLFSLAGVPITLGFIGKFYILSIIIQEHLWILGCAFLLGTLLGLYCYFNILIRLYLSPSLLPKNRLNILKNWIYTPSGILILFFGIILFILGIYPNPLISLVTLLI